jgi:hypothetical protein
MTLRASGLRVPDLGAAPTDHALARALLDQGSHYVSFLLSFSVIADYWQRHAADYSRRITVTTRPRTMASSPGIGS